MNYKGRIGEFKWWAFLLWLAACIAVALFVFRHLTFVTIPQSPDSVAASESAKTIKEIKAEADDCKAHILALEQQLKPATPVTPAKPSSKRRSQ